MTQYQSKCPECGTGTCFVEAPWPEGAFWDCGNCPAIWGFDPEKDLVEPGGPETGLKYDQDKARMDLLDSHAIEQLARVLGFGARKYAAHNWRKGLAKSRLIGAALRHLFAYLRGEDTDPETGLSHAAHAMCCCMFLLGLEHRAELDDRYKEWRP